MKESRFVWLRALLPLLCLMLMAVTCFDDPEPEPEPEPEPPKKASLTVSPNGTVAFPAEGGTIEFKITSNTAYYGYSFPRRDWMEAVIDKQKKAVVITLAANMSKDERTNNITFYGREEGVEEHAVEVNVKVTQPSAVSGQPVETVTGKLDFGTTVDMTGYTVTTNLETTSVGKDGAIGVSAMHDGKAPQPLLVCDSSDNVLMMARCIFTAGQSITVNAHTTALALMTLQPLFAPVKGAYEFRELEAMLQNAERWNAYENEVTALVKAGKPILSDKNTEMIAALDNLLDELCSDRSVAPVTKAPTQVIGNSKERPFKIEIQGKKVNFFNYGLTPMYEGKVYCDLTDQEVGTIEIPSGDDYGVTDILLRESFKWSGPVTFDFNTLPSNALEGKYMFEFSRETTKAQTDFMVNLFLNALDIVGASFSAAQTATLKQAIGKYIVARGMALTQMIMSGKYTKTELIEAIYNGVQDFLTSEEFIKGCGGMALSVGTKALLKKLSLVTTIYSALRGTGNLTTRCYYMLDAPKTVNFCVSYQKQANSLISCAYVQLEVLSGNNQVGKAGKYLDDPIMVRVKTDNLPSAANYYNLLFTIVNDDGELLDEQVYTWDLTGGTMWKLGTHDRIQHVTVDAIDVATGAVISEEPLVFVATAEDIKDDEEEGNIPAWLQGTWVEIKNWPEEPKRKYTFSAGTATFTSPYTWGDSYTGLSAVFKKMGKNDSSWGSEWFPRNYDKYLGSVWLTCRDEDLPHPYYPREVMAIFEPDPVTGYFFPSVIHVCSGDDIAAFDGAYYKRQ